MPCENCSKNKFFEEAIKTGNKKPVCPNCRTHWIQGPGGSFTKQDPLNQEGCSLNIGGEKWHLQ